MKKTRLRRFLLSAIAVIAVAWYVSSPVGFLAAFHAHASNGVPAETDPACDLDESPGNNSIRELVPGKYLKRYRSWKREYLSTAAGRKQWEKYARDRDFTLTMTVSASENRGALASDYVWNDDGRLVAATITLGDRLESGLPSPVNYPITCSLSSDVLSDSVTGKVLAAAKLAHEFGHVERTRNMDWRIYEIQQALMPEYNRIFLSNGCNPNDPRLVRLAKRMRGTPVAIAQDRESWAEMAVIEYLEEKFPGGEHHPRMPRPIKDAIRHFYAAHPDRASQ